MANVTDTEYTVPAIHGYLGQLLVGDGASPETFEAIAGVRRITPGAMTTAVIDKTHLRSPAAHREKMPGLRDSGAFSVEAIYDPTHESMTNAGGGSGSFTGGGTVAHWIDRGIRNYQIRVGTGSPQTTLPFRGFVSTWQLGEIGADDLVPVTMEFTPESDFSASLP